MIDTTKSLGEVCKKGTTMTTGVKILPLFFNHMYKFFLISNQVTKGLTLKMV